ncbi:hypothetical protein MYIN104542_09390 [Mycobacterium intermedium]
MSRRPLVVRAVWTWLLIAVVLIRQIRVGNAIAESTASAQNTTAR